MSTRAQRRQDWDKIFRAYMRKTTDELRAEYKQIKRERTRADRYVPYASKFVADLTKKELASALRGMFCGAY